VRGSHLITEMGRLSLRIKVLYFSSLKDRVKKILRRDRYKRAFVCKGSFYKFLKERYPQISQDLDNIMVAVNEEYVDTDHILKDGDTVALIPPVSGG